MQPLKHLSHVQSLKHFNHVQHLKPLNHVQHLKHLNHAQHLKPLNHLNRDHSDVIFALFLGSFSDHSGNILGASWTHLRNRRSDFFFRVVVRPFWGKSHAPDSNFDVPKSNFDFFLLLEGAPPKSLTVPTGPFQLPRPPPLERSVQET